MTPSPVSAEVSVRPGASRRLPLACAYGVEGLTSISVNFLMNGVVFYTAQQFGWLTWQNLLLMMAQGVIYTIAALSAGPAARRFGKPPLLVAVNATMILLAVALVSVSSPWAFVPILLAATAVSTFTWPLVESLVTEGCDSRQMNRRISFYNITWTSTGMTVIAVYGSVLWVWPRGPIFIPILCHAAALVAAITLLKRYQPPRQPPGAPTSHTDSHASASLASCRRMALWLGRIGLPTSFVVANSLMGMTPKLRISHELGLRWTTVLASLWMISRFFTVIVLGRTTWWHGRPRWLVAGAVLMLAAFLLIALPGERIGPFAHMPLTTLVAIIAAAEFLLGVVASYVFSASLYFGMVLSEGSTDHGGYHEALIGAGVVIGPGIAAAAQWLGPADTQAPAIIAVSLLTTLTILLMAIRASKKS